ncbi:hypothetical protein JTE90_002766 [Oedothorax gibbosus]|uniref:Uncharacterized protein n=1 Tax=Oedothorax gibbosus TaxID=931172 RepID=A0AAV6UNT1_9ARAC|nr:hypothetical protein JTE90_002766 [Oedothorax gibbosus]
MPQHPPPEGPGTPDKAFRKTTEDLDVLVQLEMKKMLLDRRVHLLSRGCAVSVVNYIKTCWQRQDTDISLISTL